MSSLQYVQQDEFEQVRPAPNTDILWPVLSAGEFVVLDADTGAYHAYVRCNDLSEAKAAIQQTLGSTVSQTFLVCRNA